MELYRQPVLVNRGDSCSIRSPLDRRNVLTGFKTNPNTVESLKRAPVFRDLLVHMGISDGPLMRKVLTVCLHAVGVGLCVCAAPQ